MIIVYPPDSSYKNGEVQLIALLETVFVKVSRYVRVFFLCNEDRLVESKGFDT